jgi:AAA15 family ATPase/GTPase
MSYNTDQHAIIEQCKPTAEGYQVIRSLEIDNFRCFKSAHLDDVRRFNILTGENGSGKTALLESIFIAGGGSAEIYLRVNAWRGQDLIGVAPALLPLFEDFFYQFDSRAGLRIKLNDSSGDQREVRIALAPTEVISLPFEHKSSEASASRDLKFIWKTPKGTIDSRIEIEAGKLRIAQPQPEDTFPIAFLNQMTLGGAKENADRFSIISSKNKEGLIEATVNRIFPQVTGLSVLTSVGLGTIHASIRGVSRKIPIGLVSSGVNKFVAILCAIAWAEHGIVLIDEIENGMYYKVLPQMWREITNFARENKTQIFAATHSKEFLEAIAPFAQADDKDHSLLHLEKENGEARITGFRGKEFAGAIKSGFEVR